ncbi:acetyl-CoA carboxylase biotin carboxylase subunit family protein [Kitasatospora sp. NPDC051853]|uniref:acetyl-CoA carboxylase biotin carboxylase subunit family protein n=1 Tax=Kitasatospora sp. NPDC051853 TaxID=3364058 RepID=UPI0037AF565E
MKPPVLFLNKHPYEHFSRGGRYILPTDEVELHIVSRNQRYGGVTGFAEHPLAHVSLCGIHDEDHWRAVGRWSVRHHGIRRVIAVHEKAVLLAAELRSEFGLPGMDFETAARFRDKVRMKEAVRNAGAAAVPGFAALDSPADLEKLDWTAGPRKVIKGRRGLAAKDLYVVEGLEEARRVVAGLDLSGARFEVEDFVRGEVYHCDSVVRDGRILFSSVGKYLADPASYSPGGIFGTVLVREGALMRRILEMNEKVLPALGLRDGTTHLELFHTDTDDLVFCEVAGRPPGGIIPPVIEHQYGFNIVETQIRLDAGLPFSLGSALDSGQDASATGFIAFYPDASTPAGIPPQRYAELGIVEYLPSPGAGDGRGGVKHSTDFRDSYVVRAPDSGTLMRRIAAVEDAYRR